MYQLSATFFLHNACYLFNASLHMFLDTTKLMRFRQLLKRCVAESELECPFNKIFEVDTVFFQRCVLPSVVKLHRRGSATNGANLSSLDGQGARCPPMLARKQ